MSEQLQEKIQELQDLKQIRLDNDSDLKSYQASIKEDIKQYLSQIQQLKQILFALSQQNG